ncbi:hypothetical protein K443DRAFT_90481 [Laccaria amethystina LaAM-08-1]|uniref:Uncharacterized protein n=1 Tax=Laccaria amethystina LaAM-08-1 TaxID=1095629 RepID=A0A0C9XWF7_9AGAR|nr:hypothetical protein K443DRAFT_90481 [Laccaria amethystina LaAM-08-1]
MSSLHVVATAIVQFFLIAWGWICNSIRNLAQFFKPFAILPQFAHVSFREPAHAQDRVLERAHQVAVSVPCGSPKDPILPMHTITQGQNSQIRGLQQPTNAIWNPYLPANLTTTPAVHSPSFTSKDLGDSQPSVICYPEPTYSPNLRRPSMRNFQAITSRDAEHLQKLDSVISPSLQDPTSTKVVVTGSTPVELPSTPTRATLVVASSTQEDHPSLYDCENTLQQVTKSFIEADALRISETQVSSADFNEHSRSNLTATSIKKKRRAVLAMPMPEFEASTDSPFRNNTTLKDPTASSALTTADSHDDSFLDVDAIIALAGTLCDPTSSSSSGSSDVAQSSTLQVDPTTPSQASRNTVIETANIAATLIPSQIRRNNYLAIEDDLEPSNSPEVTLPPLPQPLNSVGFDHLQQYHEEESALAYLQHSVQNSPRSTHVRASLETIREEDEEPSFYDDILATPSPPSHHESTFPDNRQVILQDSMYETPTTEPERKKRRFSLVDVRPRSKVVTQKKKRRSAPSILGLGWFNKTTSLPLRQEREPSPKTEPVPPLRPLLLPMQLAMRGFSTPLKHDHPSTASTHITKRRSWFKNLTSQHSPPSWHVSPPILNLIPATPPLNDKPNATIEDPTISNCAPLSIDPKFLYPADPSSVFEPDETIYTTEISSPTIAEPTLIESESDGVAENRRSKSLAELIALIDSYDFETGRMKEDSCEPGDLSSSEAQLDWAATSSSSSSSDDESYFDESEDSMSVGVAM